MKATDRMINYIRRDELTHVTMFTNILKEIQKEFPEIRNDKVIYEMFAYAVDQEIKRSQGDIPESAKKLLPRLHNMDETEVIIVTLAEATPVYEAMRLEEDLKRAGIAAKWWVINSSLYHTGTTNRMLAAKASNEIEWINKVDEHTDGKFAVIGWSPDEIKGDKLKELLV